MAWLHAPLLHEINESMAGPSWLPGKQRQQRPNGRAPGNQWVPQETETSAWPHDINVCGLGFQCLGLGWAPGGHMKP